MQEEEKISYFNEGVLAIQRLHFLWMKIQRDRQAGYLKEVEQALISVELELLDDARKIDKQKKTDYIKRLQGINEKISGAILPSMDSWLEEEEKRKRYKEIKNFFNLLISKEALI
jgi:beta-lactamase class D